MPPELQSTAELADRLRPALLHLSRRLRQMRDDDLDLNANQLSALAVLMLNGDQLMGALAAAERVQPPSMTRIVNGLEQRGLVARRPSPGDGRQCLVGLTDSGREVLLANRRRRNAWLAARLDELTDDEQAVLARAVDILAKVNHP